MISMSGHLEGKEGTEVGADTRSVGDGPAVEGERYSLISVQLVKRYTTQIGYTAGRCVKGAAHWRER